MGVSRRGFWFDTVTTQSVYAATNAPGGITNTLVARYGQKAVTYGRANSPVNAVGNALRPGHAPPGVYKASWYSSFQGTNAYAIRHKVGNRAPHADVVEFGHPSTKGGKWEVYSWHAYRGYIIRTRGTRAWKSGLGTRTGNRKVGYGLIRLAGETAAEDTF